MTGAECTTDVARLHNRDSLKEQVSVSVDVLATEIEDGPVVLYLQRPRSSETRLAERVATMVHCHDLRSNYMFIIPSRIGHSPLLDRAAESVMEAEAFRTGCCSKDICFQTLAMAIRSLRQAVTRPECCFSDDCMLAIALLAYFEATMGLHRRVKKMHLEAMDAVVRAQVATGTLSEVAQDTCLSWPFLSASFIMHVAKGVESPFDEPEWRSKMASGRWYICLEPNTLQLSKLACELFHRLPTLILKVREAHARPEDVEAWSAAVTLAHALLELQDLNAETGLLRRVHVTETASPIEAQFVAYSLQFTSRSDYQAATFYWQTRLHLLRLCARLNMTTSQLKCERSRIGTNLMMSWEMIKYWEYSRVSLGAIPIMGTLVALWGCVRDFDAFPKLGRPAVEKWVLSNARMVLNPLRSLHALEMDQLAESLAGGLPVDRFYEMFSGGG